MNKRLLFVWIAFLLLVITSCQPISGSTGIPTSQKTTVIYDDDGSPDGTTALLYLLSHPQVDLKAITIVFGEAHPQIYIQHIARQLEAFNIRGIPLGYGQDASLLPGNEFPDEARQASDAFWGFPIPNPQQTYQVEPAPQLIASTIEQSPVPVTFFLSGPHTNLAQALELAPGITENIDAVYVMGGAVYVPGNISDLYPDTQNTVAEWNIYADAQAASQVFDAGLPIYLVPLDATNQVLISQEDTAQWRQGGEISSFAADIYDSLLTNWDADHFFIWDLMIAAIMLEPDLCVFTPLHLQVVTQPGNTVGQTVVTSGEATNVTVCLEPDASGIRKALIDVFR
jgi:pyrimidine-specific ribonucleoside hydrolase